MIILDYHHWHLKLIKPSVKRVSLTALSNSYNLLLAKVTYAAIAETKIARNLPPQVYTHQGGLWWTTVFIFLMKIAE